MNCLATSDSLIEALRGYLNEIFPLLVGFIMSELAVLLYHRLAATSMDHKRESLGVFIAVFALSFAAALGLAQYKIGFTALRTAEACSLISSPGDKNRWDCQKTLLYPENNYNLNIDQKADVALGCVVNQNPRKTCGLIDSWIAMYSGKTAIPCRYYLVTADCEDDLEKKARLFDQAKTSTICDSEAQFIQELYDAFNALSALLRECKAGALEKTSLRLSELERTALRMHKEDAFQKLRQRLEHAYPHCKEGERR